MIITRTPLRISFAGGGSDLPAFYEHEQGAVLSATINKYVYITVNPHFLGHYRLSYSKTEHADHYAKFEHDIARNTLAWMNVDSGLEITSVGDVPAGTGLGSSSAYTVGLLNALHTYYSGNMLEASVLAMDANYIEAHLCEHPVGKQDHYASAYGGLNHITFSDKVVVDSLPDAIAQELFPNLLMLYVGNSRNANNILKGQARALEIKGTTYRLTRDMVAITTDMVRAALLKSWHNFYTLMHDAWQIKRNLTLHISTEEIDSLYRIALNNGAKAGKLCGAGGGGR